MFHPEVYKMNSEELEIWAGMATEIRQRIMKKASLYETYANTLKKVVNKKMTRRTIPHSTAKDNKEGLLECQIKQRVKSQSGAHAKCKKR